MASITSSLFWSAGEFMLVGLAIALPNWRHLTLLAGGMTVAVLMLYPLIPESARWLLSQGRQAEATAVVQKIAAWNGTKMPDVPLAAQTAAAAQDSGRADEEDVYIDVTRPGSMSEQQQSTAATKDKDVHAVTGSFADTSRASSPGQNHSSSIAAGDAGKSGAPPPIAQSVGLFAAMRSPRLLKRTCVMVFTW